MKCVNCGPERLPDAPDTPFVERHSDAGRLWTLVGQAVRMLAVVAAGVSVVVVLLVVVLVAIAAPYFLLNVLAALFIAYSTFNFVRYLYNEYGEQLAEWVRGK